MLCIKYAQARGYLCTIRREIAFTYRVLMEGERKSFIFVESTIPLHIVFVNIIEL